ncbi:glutaminase A [Lysobacter cavernae]|uniref:Glutaminase n=1 Tax=Lysobacter cavernae TaxID=1685901 RepID=A0ABV7RMT2_9GAMM
MTVLPWLSPGIVHARPSAPAVDQAAIKAAVDAAYAAVKGDTGGKNADYIPVLAQVPPQLFAIAVMTVDGKVYSVGDTDARFAIESVSKPFTASWLIEHKGADWVAQKIGTNQTGLPFNSIIAIEDHAATTPAMNPLVNAGAIATTSWIAPADEPKQRWNVINGILDAYAGRHLGVNETVYKSESSNYEHNRAISRLLKGYGVIESDPQVALDLYTRQCSVELDVRDLATMGATLANGGTNPATGKKVVSADSAEKTLSLMLTTGLYETTGTWSFNVGLPAKSGVGGGIVAVVPGKFAIATYAPPLDAAGNSVKGQKAMAMIVRQLVGSGVFETGK